MRHVPVVARRLPRHIRQPAGHTVFFLDPLANAATPMTPDLPLTLGRYTFHSRLIIGSGKYKDFAETRAALDASGAELITVAVRRVNITDPAKENLLDFLDLSRTTVLPNTAGCTTADECVRTARLARAAGLTDLVKVEVIGDAKTLYPDTAATLAATEILAKEGFTCLPYTTDDPVVAQRLVDAGASAIMPLAAPIGSGLGICNPYTLRILLELLTVPVIVDAGVGTASDATMVMEMGADGVLMNTAIAGAKEPVAMARAMKLGVEAGRLAYRAGRIPKKLYATASSPLEGVVR